MQYRLRRPVTGVPNFRDISKDEFNNWRLTQEKLLAVFNIEATFDLLLENCVEFESNCLSIGLRGVLFHEDRRSLAPYREVNRRVNNLLSSARLYLDQVPRELKVMYGNEMKHVDAFKEWTRKQYDSFFGYRVMEALRNHAQHFGFPVHGATYSWTWEDRDTDARLRTRLLLFVNMKRLARDSRFKPAVREELRAKADKHGNINIVLLIREYMEGLCEVHKSLRGLIAGDVASWDQTIMLVQDLAHATFGEGCYSIVATAEEEEGIWEDSEDINVDLTTWRKGLEAKNQDFGKLSALYVSGRV